MNLTKIFNKQYFKENIKQAKAMIITLFISLPLLTMVYLGVLLNDKEVINYYNMESLLIVNMILLFLFPIILSFILNGYVYKKSEVDLINSMPLSRKSIFITNTIGGILIIVFSQLITLLLSVLLGTISSGIIIAPAMAIDTFIIMTVAYIFVFSAANLAMTLSGTFITQIIVTCLLLFLIPFCNFVLNGFALEYNEALMKDGNQITYNEPNYNSMNITTPVSIILSIYGKLGNNYNYYNVTSIVKEICYSVVFIGLGIILFEKRKMENNSESFNNNWAHILVKALVIFPFVYILDYAFLGTSNITLVIAFQILIMFFYFVYDFIVRKKIKFINSVLSLIVIMFVLNASFFALNKVKDFDSFNQKYIDINEIEKYSISFNYNELSDYYIDDKEIINLIADSSKKMYDYSKISIDINNIEMDYNNIENKPNYPILLKINTKDGKINVISTSIDTETADKIAIILDAKTDYLENYKEQFIGKGNLLISGNVIEPELADKINSIIDREISKLTINQIVNSELMNNTISLYRNVYENHELKKISIPDNMNEELLNIIANFQNEKTRNALNEIDISKNDYYCSVNIVNDNDKNIINTLDEKNFYGNFERTTNEIVNYIENSKVEFDSSKDYYVLSVYSYNLNYASYFYTNDIEEIDKLINKEILLQNTNNKEDLFVNEIVY